MDILSIIIKPISFFLFMSSLYHLSISTSTNPYTPSDFILLNCGSSDNSTKSGGRHWTGELESRFGPVEPFSEKRSKAVKSVFQDSANSIPYMTARISESEFKYTFPVTAGQKFIRLHFYPSSYPGFNRSKDFFNVQAGPYTLLRNFSASFYADYGWEVKTFFREFCVNVEDNNQLLNLTFSPFLNGSYAFINGIEIISMPTNLYYTPLQGPGLTLVGENKFFYVQNDTALENVRRFNVGGNTLSPVNDTGMDRLWEDDTYNAVSVSVVADNTSLVLNYSKVPSYTAPDDVYKSARRLQKDMDDLTWSVPVDQGFMYLIRLLFCEYAGAITKANQRRFNIFIDNQIAEVGFDVFESSGGVGVPLYKDYIVKAGKKGNFSDYLLLISLLPNNSSVYRDAFLNGMEIFKLSDSNGSLAGPNSEPPPVPQVPATAPDVQVPVPTTNNKTKKHSFIVIGASVIGLVMIFSLFCCIVVVWRQRKRKHYYGSYYESLSSCLRFNPCNKGHSSIRTKASSLPEELCRQFSLAEIKAATNNFHDSLIIGKGGFGNVYKGEIDDGATTVAIKRLNQTSKQGLREFKTEITMLSQLRHVHLVSLIGFCIEEKEMLLVYDYMSNGTLRQHLYETDGDPLPWKQRLQICVGAARGFHYLHAETLNTIIHRDIKTTNILLDENWVAKVSDFGLSKIGANNAAVSTVVKGTHGYLDPEYVRRNQLTEKSDVYSFGVVLFEVLCARKAVDTKLEDEQMNLANWVRKCIENGTIHQVIDPLLMGKISPDCFNKFVEIAERCIRDNGNDRPSMHDVMENLEFALQLQEAADAEKKETGNGSEYVYPEVSFKAPRYTNVIIGGDNQLDSIDLASGSSSTFEEDTNATGLSYPSLESGTITSSHGFSVNFTSSSACK